MPAVTAEAPPLDPPLREGATPLPRYEVIAHLSRGRALDVYDAWSYERDCRCVLKLMRPDRRGHRSTRRRLLQEGRLAAGLRHPHLVAGYEVIERPQPAVVLETLDGETLAHLIARRRRRLAAADLAHLGMQLCSAMHYLHAEGFLHIDLKPSNVIADRGQAKVIDLSLARRPGRATRGVGTRAYMAPEQARGGAAQRGDRRLGIGGVLHEAAAGRPPFDPRANGVRYPQLKARAAPLSSLRRLPRALAQTLDACLEPEPAERPTVGELSEALDPFG